jgi:LysM repeat protein
MYTRLVTLALLVVVVLVASSCVPVPPLITAELPAAAGDTRGAKEPTNTPTSPVSPLPTPTQLPTATPTVTPPVSPLAQPTMIAGPAAAAATPITLPLVTNGSGAGTTQVEYVVALGDTLAKIARRFDVTVQNLMAANPNIKNADRVYVGQKLIIPAAG